MREGEAIILSECIWKCMKEVRYVSSRIMYVRVIVRRDNWSVISVQALQDTERKGSNREILWKS